MHIKKIIIQGFKTYKNTTIIDLLSPNFNVVVGRNGSGKSNFFAAIRFVLSDAYTHMTREERQGLIHEGTGTVMSAFVEIVFDNLDKRFPINRDEISIRRTIGLKKDDYSIDGKSATRSDVMNLLESAGFSRSNPYYIVPQGRITALTNSKDSERLHLLKEVSGATVFEKKLKESVKEMENSNLKKLVIDEALKSIDDRLADLQIESSDLKKFQSLDKTRKILEYKLFDKELKDLGNSIESLEDEYSELLNESQKDLDDLDRREKICQDLVESINDLKVSLRISSLDNEQSKSDYNRLLSVISEKEIELNELKATIENDKEQSEAFISSINHYKELINKHELKLAQYKPDLDHLRDEENKLKQEISHLTTQQRLLYAKKSRFQKFSNKEERDIWLQEESSRLNEEFRLKELEINKISDEIKNKENLLLEKDSRILELEENIKTGSATHQTALSQKVNEYKKKNNEFIDERNRLWREEIRLKSIHDSIQNELETAGHNINQMMDRAQAQGLKAVKAIIAKLSLGDSVYGSVAELFTVSDKYKTAVEVIAGNSLFHIVVDNDRTAALIMDEMIRTKSGRATFIPLSRLNPKEVEYPDSTKYKCIPMIKKLMYEATVTNLMKHLFGSTIICSDLQNGYELAKNYKLTAITLDGDRADTRGALSGGFRDYKRSRIDFLRIQQKKKKELINAEEELNKCVELIESISQNLNTNNHNLQSTLSEIERLNTSKEPLESELAQLSNLRENIVQDLETLNINLNSAKLMKFNFESKLVELKNELKLPFANSLSSEEVLKLEGLNQSIVKRESELNTIVLKLTDIEAKISVYESELQNNYKPHLSKLLKENVPEKLMIEKVKIDALEKELEDLKIQLDTLESRNTVSGDENKRLLKEIANSEEILNKANKQQMNIMKKLEEFSKAIERNMNRKALLALRSDELQKKIRELGVLPEEAFGSSSYDNMDSEGILKKLNSVNKELSQFSHINKKALEQFNTFTKQRKELTLRRQELDDSKESIESLIESLEAQKQDAIAKSFKQVAKSFHEIFEKLVPLGVGNLVMQKKPTEGLGNDYSGEDKRSVDSLQLSIDNYIGVSICVSFNSKNDEQQRIEQLSGGQKSLCAIALILAIQKCDPAPFYLFDEIDANLDTQYRTSVASMIHSLSKNAQFICTTFRPEMLQVANKFYGIMFGNKVSTVSEINRDEAMTFVEGNNHS